MPSLYITGVTGIACLVLGVLVVGFFVKARMCDTTFAAPESKQWLKKSNLCLLAAGAVDLLTIIIYGAIVGFGFVIQGVIFQLIVSIIAIVYGGLLMGKHAENCK